MSKAPIPGKIIIPSGVIPEKHELITATAFTKLGIDIEFIQRSRTKSLPTPDVVAFGLKWEIKCPTGNSKHTVQTQLKRASKQSNYVIFDSHRTKLDDEAVQNELSKQLRLSRSLKRVILVNKARVIIEI